MTEEQLAALAAKLSKAQIAAVRCAINGVIPSHYPTAIRISSPTLRRLHNLGVTELWPPRLTPEGNELSAYLEGATK